jgi:hypothetical protein
LGAVVAAVVLVAALVVEGVVAGKGVEVPD